MIAASVTIAVGVLLLFMFVIPLQSAKISTATGTDACLHGDLLCSLCTGTIPIGLPDAPPITFHLLLGQLGAYQHAIHDPSIAQYYQCESAYISIRLFL